jgi:tRNA pseudouridine65 synthase
MFRPKTPLPPLEVLFEDEGILVINKQSGIPVHKGWAADSITLCGLVRRHTGLEYAWPIHRLDRGASGVVVFAKSRENAAALSLAFRNREPTKTYLALVRGSAPDAGHIDHALKDENGNEQEAWTDFETLQRVATSPRETSLVKALPGTGRLHQVRRHLKHAHHPLIGDSGHGEPHLNRAFKTNYGLGRLALHACRLEFEHPVTGLPCAFDAPLPEDLWLPLKAMGYGLPSL